MGLSRLLCRSICLRSELYELSRARSVNTQGNPYQSGLIGRPGPFIVMEIDQSTGQARNWHWTLVFVCDRWATWYWQLSANLPYRAQWHFYVENITHGFCCVKGPNQCLHLLALHYFLCKVSKSKYVDLHSLILYNTTSFSGSTDSTKQTNTLTQHSSYFTPYSLSLCFIYFFCCGVIVDTHSENVHFLNMLFLNGKDLWFSMKTSVTQDELWPRLSACSQYPLLHRVEK